jgi:hypothetical protein
MEPNEHSVTVEFHFFSDDMFVVEGVTEWRYVPEHAGSHPAYWLVHEYVPTQDGSKSRHHKVFDTSLQYITVTIYHPPVSGGADEPSERHDD